MDTNQTNIIERRILLIREQKVMLDSDLAELYGVTTKRLNEQVRRNIARFPEDFMFQLNSLEAQLLRSHFATLKQGQGQHRKYLPLAFTEQGIAMLSSVLNSDQAIQVNIAIMRAFVQLRNGEFSFSLHRSLQAHCTGIVMLHTPMHVIHTYRKGGLGGHWSYAAGRICGC